MRRRAQHQAEITAQRKVVLDAYERTRADYNGLAQAISRLQRTTNFDDALGFYEAHRREMLSERDKLHQYAERQPLRCYELRAELKQMRATRAAIRATDDTFNARRSAIFNSILDVHGRVDGLRQSFQVFR